MTHSLSHDPRRPKASHGRSPEGPWARWQWRTSERLILTVTATALVTWSYEGASKEERESGAELQWTGGHLVAIGPDGEALFALLGELEIPPAAVDAELRAATDWEAPPE